MILTMNLTKEGKRRVKDDDIPDESNRHDGFSERRN